MKQPENPRALITGSSSGIGFAYARYLSKDGWDLDLVSQNRERSEAARAKLGGRPTTIHLADLCDQSQTSALFRKIVTPDLIVANAGITHASSAGKTEEKRRLELTYLLYGGVVDLIEHYLPKMLERGAEESLSFLALAQLLRCLNHRFTRVRRLASMLMADP